MLLKIFSFTPVQQIVPIIFFFILNFHSASAIRINIVQVSTTWTSYISLCDLVTNNAIHEETIEYEGRATMNI